MDLKHKHWAVIVLGALVAAFAVLAAWYMFRGDHALAPAPETATSTPGSSVAVKDVPQHIVEHAAYYDIDLTYPNTTPLASLSASADAVAIAQMKKFAQDYAAQFKKDGDFANLTQEDIQMEGLGQDHKYALSSEYEVFTGTRTVSYVYEIYEDTLGAHPNGYYRTFTYDLKTGQEVALKDLFVPTIPYLDRISGRVRADLPAIIKKMSGGYDADQDMLKLGTGPDADNFSAFYLDGKNLVIIFPPYAVGPYALGTVRDTIPLAQFADSVKPEYK